MGPNSSFIVTFLPGSPPSWGTVVHQLAYQPTKAIGREADAVGMHWLGIDFVVLTCFPAAPMRWALACVSISAESDN